LLADDFAYVGVKLSSTPFFTEYRKGKILTL